MTSRPRLTSPKLYARVGGVLYLIIILAGLWGEIFVRARLIVPGDAAATAHKIAAAELLYRSGIAGDILMHICDLPSTLIFYLLLKPVNKDLSMLSAAFGFLQTAILCANKLNLVAVTLFLGGAGYLQAFTPGQLQALASLSLSMHEYGFGIGLIFFGVSCLIGGYLLFRSGYFPRTVGVLQIVAGVSYLVNSFSQLLFPAFAEKLLPGILLAAFLGELGTCLYLIIWGLNVKRWNEQTGIGPILQEPNG
jgi:hypothetical protein